MKDQNSLKLIMMMITVNNLKVTTVKNLKVMTVKNLKVNLTYSGRLNLLENITKVCLAHKFNFKVIFQVILPAFKQIHAVIHTVFYK